MCPSPKRKFVSGPLIYIFIYNIYILVISTYIAKRPYEMINHTGKYLNCPYIKLVYLLTSNFCSTQYEGNSIYIRMNCHRTAELGFEHIIYHSRSSWGSHVFYQILEKLSETSCNQLDNLDNCMTQIWLKR